MERMVTFNLDKAITLTDVAKKLGRSRRAVDGWCQRGLLQSWRLGRIWYTTTDAVQDFVRQREPQRDGVSLSPHRRQLDSDTQEAVRMGLLTPA